MVLSLAWPDWIEALFGVNPDHGSGATEWLVVGIFLLVSVTGSFAARTEWRRAAEQS